MKSRFLLHSNESFVEGNIYADKSSLVLDWLLRRGVEENGFALREVAREIGVSLGLVQRVLRVLVFKGLIRTEGTRTAKRFFFKKPDFLLKGWLEQYSIMKKCKMWTYHSSFQSKAELLHALKKAKLREKVVLALHSAAEAIGCKNTNLSTLELYMLDPASRSTLEDALHLEPQGRGYDVLLIEPYYKSLLHYRTTTTKSGKVCPALLAFLDLYHFPLRGYEQAEFMADRVLELKRIYKNGWSK